MRLHRTALKVLLLTAGLMPGHFIKPAQPPTVTNRNTPAFATETYYPEVRLRKVHLVRPDLIFYPLDYEIFC